MEDRIEYVQIRLSSKHPKADFCNDHAQVDGYGLGIYPRVEVPKPSFHSHCYCLTASRMDLIHPKPKFNPKAEQAFLESLPKNEARDVAGSWEKQRRILKDRGRWRGFTTRGKTRCIGRNGWGMWGKLPPCSKFTPMCCAPAMPP